MDVSRSGRVRKKSSKLADFESPDEIDVRYGGSARTGKKGPSKECHDVSSRTTTPSTQSQVVSRSCVVDETLPEQFLADEKTVSPKTHDSIFGVNINDDDFDFDVDLDIDEDELNSIPLVGMDCEDDEDLDVGDENDSQFVQRSVAGEGQDRNNDSITTGEDEGVEEGNLMIDESGQNLNRKSRRSTAGKRTSVLFEDELREPKKSNDLRTKTGIGQKARRRDKGKTRYTAFLLWYKSIRDEVVAQNPGLSFAEISKLVGEMWARVPSSEKYNWKKKTQRLHLKLARQEEQAEKVERQQLAAKAAQHASQSNGYQVELSTPVSGPSIVKSTSPNAKSVLAEQLMASSGILYKVVGTDPIDCAAHLKLLGESLSTIGKRLTEHEGQIAVSGSLSVLLDSLLCATGPLLCLTQQIPELDGVPQETLSKILDNVAYIMPGL